MGSLGWSLPGVAEHEETDEQQAGEHGVAVLAVPELDGFEFFSAFAFLRDACAGAVEAALLAFADYRFDWKFGHKGDA